MYRKYISDHSFLLTAHTKIKDFSFHGQAIFFNQTKTIPLARLECVGMSELYHGAPKKLASINFCLFVCFCLVGSRGVGGGTGAYS